MSLTQTILRHLFFLASCLCSIGALAQVSINNTNSQPDSSAMLDVQSNNKGLLIPRMSTSQLQGINHPAEGLMVYDTDKKKITTYSNRQGWEVLDVVRPGSLFMSQFFPDTLYPNDEYEYLGYGGTGTTGIIQRRNTGFLPGDWITKTSDPVYNNFPPSNNDYSHQIVFYTGSATNKVIKIGSETATSLSHDSAVIFYDLTLDSVYVDPNITINRAEFTASVDTSNNRIFIYGGGRVAGASAIIHYPYDEGFIYNYVTGTKTAMDTLTGRKAYKRWGHTAVWAGGSINKLFVFGGSGRTSVGIEELPDNKLYAYDPSANNWSLMASSPLTPGYFYLAVYDDNDQIIFWGGRNYGITGTNFYNGAIYKISSNSWIPISTTNAPDTTMSIVNWTGTEMLISNTYFDYGSNSQASYRAYRYNPVANTWAKIPAIPLQSGYLPYVFANLVCNKTNNTILQLINVPGANNQQTLWAYSLTNNTWTALAASNIEGTRIIQAGDKTIASYVGPGSFGYFQRYVPTGSSPNYKDGGFTIYLYRKR